MRLIFTGIRPTGKIHIGNLIGMFNDIRKYRDYTYLFMVADLHGLVNGSVTDEDVHLKVAELAAVLEVSPIEDWYIFRQSDNPDHLAAFWYLNTIVNVTQLTTMIEYKISSTRNAAKLNYPVLMAADILIYRPTMVPVGEDQRQHIELYNTLVDRLNRRSDAQPFSKIKARGEEGIRIMDLQDPSKKMSKSNGDERGLIYLQDDAEDIYLKVRRAVTSSNAVSEDYTPGTLNLLRIAEFCLSEGPGGDHQATLMNLRSVDHLYLKEEVSRIVSEYLLPVKMLILRYKPDGVRITSLLQSGSTFARSISQDNFSYIRGLFTLKHNGLRDD